MSQTLENEYIVELHRQAQECVDAGDLQGARQIWEAILQFDPNDENALALLNTPEAMAAATGAHEIVAPGAAPVAPAATPVTQTPDPAATQSMTAAQAQAAMQQDAHTPDSIELELDPHAPSIGVAAPAPTPEATYEEDGNTGFAFIEEEMQLDLTHAPPPPEQRALESAPSPTPPSTPTPTPTPSEAQAVPSPHVTSPFAAPLKGPTEGTSLRDLVDAADDLNADTGFVAEDHVEQVALPTADATAGESAILLSRAKQAIEDADYENATQLASRALALDENDGVAQDLLSQAKRLTSQQSNEAERLISNAISDVENGMPDRAIDPLERALKILPHHGEAQEYLERARAEMQPAGVAFEEQSSCEITFGGLEEENSIGAIVDEDLPTGNVPLGEVSPQSPADEEADAFVNALQGHADQAEDAEGAGGLPPVDFDGPAINPPAGFETSAGAPLGGEDLPLAAQNTGPLLAESQGATGQPLPPPSALGKHPVVLTSSPGTPDLDKSTARSFDAPVRISTKRGSKVVILLAVFALAVAGGWWFMNRDSETATDEPPAPIRRAASSAPPIVTMPDSATDADPADGEPGADDPQREAKLDPSQLVARAERAFAAGNAAEAAELLDRATAAKPTEFRTIERLQALRTQVDAELEGLQQIEAGKAAFQQGNYAEALRLFYRLPQDRQTREIAGWIADGWYNLGIDALRQGDLMAAKRFFGDSLELSPQDGEARRNRELADRYRTRELDDAFRIYVSALEMRTID